MFHDGATALGRGPSSESREYQHPKTATRIPGLDQPVEAKDYFQNEGQDAKRQKAEWGELLRADPVLQ